MEAMILKEPHTIEEEPLAMVEIGAEDSVDAAQHLWKWTTICGRLCCNRAIIALGEVTDGIHCHHQEST